MKRILLSAFSALALLLGQKANAQQAIAITDDNKVFSFDVSNPAMATMPIAISGLPMGTQLVGMDIRPATGQVYVLGYNSTLQTGQLFTVNPTTLAVAAVGNPITGFVLSGRVAFDFNPTVDRIRVVTSDKQNYRLHPTTGAIVATDGMLAYSGTDMYFGVKPNIGSAAYTNSFIASTATTLYNIDDSLNVLTAQNPPNNGVQNTIGNLGIQINWNNPTTDFDIYFNPTTRTNDAYLVANTGSSMLDSVYRVNLTTGATMAVGALNQPVMDIAILIDRTMPAVSGNIMYGLTSNNNLISFYSNTPWYIVNAMPIAGLPAGYNLVGMDMRVANRQYYALAYHSVNMVAKVFMLDVNTAMLMPVSADSITNIDLSGTVGVDFNPVADRLRVVTSKGKNYRINQLTGLLAATDGNLAYGMADVNVGKMPNIATAAYTNSFAGTTATTMYTYDDSLNTLNMQTPPNDGTQITVGASGIMQNLIDRTTDLDIYYNHLTQTNWAYLSANSNNNFDNLYGINLTTGATQNMGSIGYGVAVVDITVMQDTMVKVMARSQTILGLTNANELVMFDAANPAMHSAPMAITGVASSQDIVGMDVRPLTGEVYLLGYNMSMNQAQLYKLDTASKMAMTVGSSINLMLNGKVGFDFNPTVDRIRVITSGGQNYRLHPITGALVATDGMLMYNTTDVNAGAMPRVASGAYTNSYPGATTTALYNFDDSLNVITLQNPPNNGVQNTIGKTGLMVNAMDATSDMDIYYNPQTMQNEAYLVANSGTNTNDVLYLVNLTSGKVGFVGNTGLALKDIAVPIQLTKSAPMGKMAYALTQNNYLVSFYTGNPSQILTHVPVSGLSNGQVLVGMDVRATDLKMYGLGYNANTMVARVYTINPVSGLATPVSADSISGIDLSGNVGVDFNPVADRMRVVTSNNKNYRINQLTGMLAAVDSTLAFNISDMNAGANPYVATVAYSNSKVGATTTTMYIFDDSLNVFGTQNPPNAGILNTIAASNIMVNAMDRTSDMDVYYNHETDSNEAYFIANTMNNNDMLYMLNLNNGMATPIGSIGWGIAIKDFAIQLDSTPVVSGLARLNANNITFTAYPNPIGNEVTLALQSKVSGNAAVRIIDITGREVLHTNTLVKQGLNELVINTIDFKSGIYFVTVILNNQQTTLKLIK